MTSPDQIVEAERRAIAARQAVGRARTIAESAELLKAYRAALKELEVAYDNRETVNG